jgi:DNA-binding response OmpR family regulator
MAQARILVIDDDDDVREILTTRLRRAGLEVVTASNGAAGLEAVGKYHPTCVLLDLVMPHMDGFDFLAALRGKHQMTLPVYIVTQRDDVDRGVIHRLGAQGLVTKTQALERTFAQQLYNEICRPHSDPLQAAA